MSSFLAHLPRVFMYTLCLLCIPEKVVGILSQGNSTSAYVMGISTAKTILRSSTAEPEQIYSMGPLYRHYFDPYNQFPWDQGTRSSHHETEDGVHDASSTKATVTTAPAPNLESRGVT